MVEAALLMNGPVYMRFGRFACPIFNDEGYKFEIGKGVLLADGTDVTLVANGYMVHLAMEAREMLAKEGISAAVINMHTIKPLDTEIILSYAKKTGAFVTAEEHSIIGGLGAAVAEAVSESCPAVVRRVGVEDKFGKSGAVPTLLEEYGLTAEHIYEEAKKAVSLKK